MIIWKKNEILSLELSWTWSVIKRPNIHLIPLDDVDIQAKGTEIIGEKFFPN